MSLEDSIRKVIREEIVNALKEFNTLNEAGKALETRSYPEILKAGHIADILGCSKRIAYDLMERKDFPLIRIGRLKRVNKTEFYKWLKEYEDE